MIIKNVSIQNFFCYVGPVSLDFMEGLNIVSARNSGGKSHLFNAFHWTFFNKIYVDSENSKKEWRDADKIITLPDYVIANAEENEVIKTSIKIDLSSESHLNEEFSGDLLDYTFERVVHFKKSNNEIIPMSRPELQISFVNQGETVFLKNGEHEWFLNLLFPKSIRKFMWFQGETVDELYDFSNPSTLNYAINEISYFPIYENLVEITKKSISSIDKKIDNELKKLKKFSVEQEGLSAEIEVAQKKIQNREVNIVNYRNDIFNLTEAILVEENKLKGYDKYTALKAKVIKLDYEIKAINDKIDQFSGIAKEKFISKWMLNKCDSLVLDSTKNLEIISAEIKAFQKTDNPVPITLPGPEYVQKMLDDHICYICEREVEDGSVAYQALVARMEDFRANQAFKILSDNYTELGRFKRNLLSELHSITEEVIESEREIEKLLAQRKKLRMQRDSLYSEFGITSDSEIQIGYTTADQILSKIRSLNSSKSSLDIKLKSFEDNNEIDEVVLKDLLLKKSKIVSVEDSISITEVKAKSYIEVVHQAVLNLKKLALMELIKEITEESNILYNKYLGGVTQGEIEIDGGVRIVDKKSKKQLSNLNTAELTAQKLAVANSFLSLSEKKMNRSFPLLADAPTSQFDDKNTLHLTENLSESFSQIIIMSKDYNKLSSLEKSEFIIRAKISKYYELRNDLVDPQGNDSRENKKTYIDVIK
jgi:hypothetical protein